MKKKKPIEIKISARVLSCPFCGRGENTMTLLQNGDDLWFVVCDANKGGCGASTGRRVEALMTLDLWNTRGGILQVEQEDLIKEFLAHPNMGPKKKRR